MIRIRKSMTSRAGIPKPVSVILSSSQNWADWREEG